MADAMALDTVIPDSTKGTSAVVDGKVPADTSKVQVPGYVKGQLGGVGEALLTEIQGDPSLATRLPKGIPELYQSWRTLHDENSSAVRVPAKDAPKEAWDRYYKSIGRPDGPDKYALTIPKLPNGLPYNDRLEKWFRKELFEAGIPQDSAQKIFDHWNETQVAAFEANVKAQEAQRVAFAKQTEETLKAEWKDDFPKNIQTMQAALARFGGTEVLEVLKNSRDSRTGVTLDNHPAFVKMLYEVGRRMDEDHMVGGETAPGTRDQFQNRVGLPVNPRTGEPMPQFFPNMEKDPKYRVKAE